MKGAPPCHDDANRYCAVGMQSLEIFEITIKEWVLIIPFDFQRDPLILVERPDVIDQM